jgi:hypothetical protein
MASDFPAYVTAEYEHGTEVMEFTPSTTAGETAAKAGELMYFDTATQTIKRCGADPALIAGISEVESEKARLLTENGKIPLRLLKPNALVAMCSATTPAETHVAVSTGYGIVRLSSGNWAVDTGDTGNARVFVVRVDIAKGIFFVKFMAANLQFDAIAS